MARASFWSRDARLTVDMLITFVRELKNKILLVRNRKQTGVRVQRWPDGLQCKKRKAEAVNLYARRGSRRDRRRRRRGWNRRAATGAGRGFGAK